MNLTPTHDLNALFHLLTIHPDYRDGRGSVPIYYRGNDGQLTNLIAEVFPREGQAPAVVLQRCKLRPEFSVTSRPLHFDLSAPKAHLVEAFQSVLGEMAPPDIQQLLDLPSPEEAPSPARVFHALHEVEPPPEGIPDHIPPDLDIRSIEEDLAVQGARNESRPQSPQGSPVVGETRHPFQRAVASPSYPVIRTLREKREELGPEVTAANGLMRGPAIEEPLDPASLAGTLRTPDLLDLTLDRPRTPPPSWSEAFKSVVQNLFDERARQDAKWGTGDLTDDAWLKLCMEELGEVALAMNDDAKGGTKQGTVPDEVLQFAALGCAWLESMKRQGRLSGAQKREMALAKLSDEEKALLGLPLDPPRPL